jgi:hypothetical protein
MSKKYDKESSNFINNLYFISAVGRFNCERIQLIQKYYNHVNLNRQVFKDKISLEDIIDFGKKDMGNFFHDHNQSLLEEAILTIPGDIHVGWNLSYIPLRYCNLENEFKNEIGFNINLLAWLEKIIRDRTILAEYSLGIRDILYEFKSKEEYANPWFLIKPNKNFQQKWAQCITLSEEEVLEIFIDNIDIFEQMYKEISGLKYKVESIDKYHQLRKADALKMLDYLCRDLKHYNYSSKWDFFLKPLIRIEDNNGEKNYFIPFPHLIGSTTQFRIENSIKNSSKLEKNEQKNKGKIVEMLVKNVLISFPNTNIIRNFHYKVNSQDFENDILLILENSLWVIEIKSHPLLRKIPGEINKIIPIYIDKIKEGIKQAQRTIDFLKEHEEILFHLNFNKKFNNFETGIIVILDSFFPHFITNNKMYDTERGTYDIYNKLDPSTRLSVFTLLDLYLLSPQLDKDKFEDYLIWKTSHLGKFPIITFDEPDKWSFYNDRFLKNTEYQKAFKNMVESDCTVFYTSGRFNDKKYLGKLVKDEE